MTTLSQKEKQGLQNVFDAISDRKPRRGSGLFRLRFMMQMYCISPLQTLPKKLLTRRI